TASTAAATATRRASGSASRSCGRLCEASTGTSSSSRRLEKGPACGSCSTAHAYARRRWHERRLDGAQRGAEAPASPAPGADMSSSILVVDDDPGVLDVVSFMLRREGFDVDEERDGSAALEAARAKNYDIVILDIMLPGMSGTDICRELRSESDVPILMLTARDAEIDRVLGLELGADDYVTKPFSTAELLSRVRAILRRRELDRANGGATLRNLGGLQIDLGRHEVRVDGDRV